MKKIMYFISGYIFMSVISPILEKIAEATLNRIQVYNAKNLVTLTKYQVKLEEEANGGEVAPNVIGFQVPNTEDYDEDDDYEE